MKNDVKQVKITNLDNANKKLGSTKIAYKDPNTNIDKIEGLQCDKGKKSKNKTLLENVSLSKSHLLAKNIVKQLNESTGGKVVSSFIFEYTDTDKGPFLVFIRSTDNKKIN